MKNNDTCRSTDVTVSVSLPFNAVNVTANLHTESAPSSCALSLTSSSDKK